MGEDFPGGKGWMSNLYFPILVRVEFTGTGQGNEGGSNETLVIVIHNCHNRSMWTSCVLVRPSNT